MSLQNMYNKNLSNPIYSKCLKAILDLYGQPFIVHYTERADGKKLFDALKVFSGFDNQSIIQKTNEIGQIFFLKKLQNYVLNESSEVEANTLNTEIKSLNEINLLILKNNININFIQNEEENNNEENNNNPDTENLNVADVKKNKKIKNNLDLYYNNLCSFFDDLGYIDSNRTFYINLGSMQYMPLILAAITHNELEKIFYFDKKANSAKKQKSDNFELFYFTNGVFNILYQMGKSNIIIFAALLTDLLKLKLLNQFTLKDYKTIMNTNLEIPRIIGYLQLFLKELVSSAEIDLDYFELGFNSYLMLRNVYR